MDGGDTRPATAPEPTTASLRVYLLGRFEVVRDGAPIPQQAWRRRRPADLLKLLALTPGRALSREEVVEKLWPDKDPANGANNLHRALYDLRQVLAGRWVDLERGQVRLRAEAWVDVDAFEVAAGSSQSGDQEAAAALYRGDLSPEDLDSPWLAQRRIALRSLFAEVALPLARSESARAEAPAAISLLRRVIEVDPSREEPHRLLLRLLAESGRRAEALRQYDAYEAALRARSLGTPTAELRALRDAIQRGEIGPAHARLPYDGCRRTARRLLGTHEPAPLRGRTGALVLLESLVEQGSGTLVLLGERGVGKTRLALEGARIAQRSGALVVSGLFEPSRAAPYAGFEDLFADYLRAGGAPASNPFACLGRGAIEHEVEKTRLFDAVAAQLSAMGAGRSVYLLLDDVHHADESSANLLHFLCRSASALKLMLVATCREDAVHAGAPVQMLLADLDCERLARGVRVQRLDLAASKDQIADLLGAAPSEALAAQLYRLTDGSPFYNEELARAFKESGHVKLAEDPVAAVREWVVRLGPRVVALLEAASAMGRRFDFEIVRPATGLTGHEALAALDRVLETRIVDEDGEGHHFHHSLVREAIYGALSPARRVQLHRAIADAIEARAAASAGGLEDAAEGLAHHRRAGDQPDLAFAPLVAAGHRAAARAGLSEAESFYTDALGLADAAGASGPRRLELLEALGDVHLAQADLSGAARVYQAAATLCGPSGWRPSPEQRARARRGAATALLVGGRNAEARAQLEAALADALLGAGDERGAALLLLSRIAWHEGRPRDALEAARRCTEEAVSVGDAALAGRGRDMAALAAGCLGELAPGGEPPEGGDPGPERPFEIHLVLWENDLLGDRPCFELEQAAAAFRDRARWRQAFAASAVARALEGTLALRAARFEPAERALREARRGFREVGSALGEAFAIDGLAGLLTATGRIEEAMSLLGEGILVAERASLRRHALARLHAGLARNRLAAGAIYAAEDAVREASALVARHGDCAVCHALFRPELIRVALARGRLGEAESEAAELTAMAERRGGRALIAIARQAHGRVLAAQGAQAEAAETLVQAATELDALGMALEAAISRGLAAASLRAQGGSEQLEKAELLGRCAEEVLMRMRDIHHT